MYRIGGERISLDLGGPSVEVEPIHSWAVQAQTAALAAAFAAASGVDAEYTALERLCALFVMEAQPQWDIVDHRGPVPTTAAGMMRLPIELITSLIGGWQEVSSEPVQAASAVDALIPPGPLNTALKRRLAAAKRKKKAA